MVENLKRRSSLNDEKTAAQNVKMKILRKASTMPQHMMDEFLARQEFYEKQRIKPPISEPSKLKEVVHEARRGYKMRNCQNLSMIKEKQPIKSIHPVKEEIQLTNAFLFCLFFLLFGMMYQSC